MQSDIARSLTSLTVVAEHISSPLAALKPWKTAFAFVQEALTKPLSELPRWLWSYECPASLDPFEAKLICVMQFVLTNFAGKCGREEYNVGLANLESSFWVDRVVPIFQAFGDHTGLLSFQWNEVSAENQNCTPGKTRHVGGVGYDEHNEERLIIESSNGQLNENIRHTADDTVKQIHSAIASLNCDIANNMDANFLTMVKSSIFEVHLVETKMTLSTVRLNDDFKGYLYEEILSCEIPTLFQNRSRWLRTFDLLAKLMELMREQKSVYEKLKAENDGAIEVDDDMTVRTKLGIQ